jgi:hypothetical protein
MNSLLFTGLMRWLIASNFFQQTNLMVVEIRY